MMELREFISGVIENIAMGVSDAAGALSESGAIVNPHPVVPDKHQAPDTHGYFHTELNPDSFAHPVQKIEFDVAVTAASKAETKSGITVLAGVFGGGVAAGSTSGNETGSRIKFYVPLALPFTKAQNSEHKFRA